jgi:hypothetical protein
VLKLTREVFHPTFVQIHSVVAHAYAGRHDGLDRPALLAKLCVHIQQQAVHGPEPPFVLVDEGQGHSAHGFASAAQEHLSRRRALLEHKAPQVWIEHGKWRWVAGWALLYEWSCRACCKMQREITGVL